MARKFPHGRPTSLASQTEERSGDTAIVRVVPVLGGH